MDNTNVSAKAGQDHIGATAPLPVKAGVMFRL